MAARRYQSKSYKPKKKKLSPYTVAGIILLCLVLCGTVTYKTHLLKKQRQTYDKQIEQLKKEQAEQDERQKELEDFRKYVKTDEYAEKIARDKLGLVHEGEIVFQPEDD